MSIVTFEQLAGPVHTGIVPQKDEGYLSYSFLKDNDDLHLLMHSFNGGGERLSFVVSRDEFKKLAEKKVPVSRAEIENRCGNIESFGTQSADDAAVYFEARDNDKAEDDNKVQIEAEAKAAKNTALINSIKTMFRNPKIDCEVISKERKLPTVMNLTIPLPAPTGPVTINTVTSCAWGQLQFVITRITPKKMIITNNDIVYKDYREFMYSMVHKSSKTSMGIGINFNVGSSLFSGGPVIGDAVYVKGVKQKDSTGIGLKFNMTRIKQYYNLTIKANQRIIAHSKCSTTVIDM